VDRRKQGLKRSVAVDAHGVPLGAVAAPANRRDDGLLSATLDTLGSFDPLPVGSTVHLDAGYDWQPCRDELARLTDRRARIERSTRWRPSDFGRYTAMAGRGGHRVGSSPSVVSR
jgi:hypothetical protein